MAGEIVPYARTMVELLRVAGVKNATTRASAATPPCVLVVPVPDRVYDLQHGYTATWSVLCLAPEPGDERAAEQLDELVEAVASVLPIESATAEGYVLPSSQNPVPAYRCRFTTDVENHS